MTEIVCDPGGQKLAQGDRTELGVPDDALLRAVLIKLFADRQLAVDESLVSYVVTRIERSIAAARVAVATLDQASLGLQRPVNRALAAAVLRGFEA